MIPRLGFPAVDASQSVVGQCGYAEDRREEFFPSRPSLGRNPNRHSRPLVNASQSSSRAGTRKSAADGGPGGPTRHGGAVRHGFTTTGSRTTQRHRVRILGGGSRLHHVVQEHEWKRVSRAGRGLFQKLSREEMADTGAQGDVPGGLPCQDGVNFPADV